VTGLKKKVTVFLFLFFSFIPLSPLSSASYEGKVCKEIFSVRHLLGNLYLFNSKIDLSREDIRERFEREYFQFLEKKGLLFVIAKRHLRYKRLIEEELRKFKVHPDIQYLVLAESYLNPRAVSKAEAKGLWQFVKETGKKEGLRINDVIDERYDIVRSTGCALTYLRKLYEEFGDWFLACAAYNAGEKRIKEALLNQNTRNFFDLYLPEETERYVFRILALKEIIENRERYGIEFDEGERYKELSVDYVVIRLEGDLHTSILASSMGLSYREFRYLNLHMKKYILPKGTYNVYFPREKRSTFIENLKIYPFVFIEER